MTVLGAGLLWFGWFGFNAGSAMAANGLAAQALMVTTVAAAAGTLTWVGASYAEGPQGQRRRRGRGCRRRPRGHHPGGRLRDRRWRARARPRGWRDLLRRHAPARPPRDRRRTRRLLGPRRRRHVGRRSASASSRSPRIGGVSGLIEGNVDQLVNQLIAVVVHGRVLLGHDLRHHQGHRHRPRPARRHRGRGAGPRHRRPRRDRLRALVRRSRQAIVAEASPAPPATKAAPTNPRPMRQLIPIACRPDFDRSGSRTVSSTGRWPDRRSADLEDPRTSHSRVFGLSGRRPGDRADARRWGRRAPGQTGRRGRSGAG